METRSTEPAKSDILEILRDNQFSAPEIARKTGYSRPTVDAYLSGLLSNKIIRRKGVGESTGGRRPMVYCLNDTGRVAIGVAVAIPGIAGVLVDLGGQVIAQEETTIPIWSHAEVLVNETAALIERLTAKIPAGKIFDGISVAVPGLVDTEKGVSVFFSRLSTFYNTPIRDMLAKKLSRPVSISRYLGSVAYSQIFQAAKGAGHSPILYIELGEGIDMALFIDGKPCRGASGNEGGLGHMVVESNGRTCLCGAKGCLEAYASNRVLIDETLLRVRNGEPSSIPTGSDMTDEDFYQYVRLGDPVALAVAERGMDYLALGVANVVNLLNPSMVILSGDITRAGEPFLAKIRDRIRLHALNALAENLEIRFMPFELSEGARGVGLLRLYEALNVLI